MKKMFTEFIYLAIPKTKISSSVLRHKYEESY